MGQPLSGTRRDMPLSGHGPAIARLGAAGRGAVVVGGIGAAILYGVLQLVVGPHVPGVRTPVETLVLLLPHLAATGVFAVLLLTAAARPRAVDLAGDALLLTLVGAFALIRALPGPGAATGFAAADPGSVLRVIALLPPILAALIVLPRWSRQTRPVSVLLTSGSLLLATQALLMLPAANPAGWWAPGAVAIVAGMAGLGLAAAGIAQALSAGATPVVAPGRRQSLSTGLIVPGAAVFIGLALVDLGLRPPSEASAFWTLALLAGVLAVRVTQLTRAPASEADQQRQLEHTQALVDVSHALAGTTDLDETLRVISESAREVLRAGAAGIELVSEDGRYLESRAVVGMSRDILGFQFPLDGSFTGWVVRRGETRATADPSRDPYIQPESLAYLGRSPIAASPIRFRDETLGVLFACNRDEPFDSDELRLLGALAEQAAIGIDNARLFEQVTILSVTDPLTGLANRRQLERELEREFAAARRGRDLVAVIFDLDDFKTYNDAHGHLAGDEALQAFASALLEETRAMNLAARYGGDEFVALLAGTDASGARAFVERIRARFNEMSTALGRGGVSFSAGVGAFAPEMAGAEELLRRADDDLYREKSGVEA